jgi:hypothetical protein
MNEPADGEERRAGARRFRSMARLPASRRRRHLSTLVLFLALAVGLGKEAPVQTTERASVQGRVTSSATGDPLELANVFFANTTLGVSSDPSGRFSLRNIPPGTYQIVVSLVGYMPARAELILRPGAAVTMDFRLTPREVRAEEVQVEAEEPLLWKRELEQFQRAFLGTTENARLCTITNPQVINFRRDQKTRALLAETDSTIVIDNRSLGYRLYVVLEKFDWDTETDVGRYSMYPRFEQLVSVDRDDSLTWRHNRLKTYEGSLKQFLLALIDGKIQESMFSIGTGSIDDLRRGGGQIVRDDEILLAPDLAPRTLKLMFTGWVRVDYKNVIPAERSYMKMESPYAKIDLHGNLLTPFALLVSGEWGKRRVADLLPIEGE